ncbi:MAG: flippase [Candidatus Wallbacteria bacterium]|nr:flippase [Candidatus Wallbacteria bacterium]
MRNPFLRNFGALVTRHVLSKLLALLWMGYLSRALGVAVFGDYVMLLSLQYVFAFSAEMGTGPTLVRRVAHARAELPRCLKTLLGLRVMLGLAASVLFLATTAATPMRAELREGSCILALYLLVASVAAVGDATFAALEDLHVASAANIASSVAVIVSGVWMVSRGAGLRGAFWAQVAGGCAIGIAYVVAFGVRGIRPGGEVDRRFVGEFLWEAFRIGGPNALGAAYGRVDRLLLARFVDAGAAGLYHTATMMMKPLSDLYFAVVPPILFPAMTRVHKTSPQAFRELVRAALHVFQGLTVPAALVLCLYSSDAMGAVFGAPFAASGRALTILAVSLPCAVTGSVFSTVLLIEKRSSANLGLSALSIGLSLCLNLALIPRLGMPAAAISATATQLLMILLCGRQVGAVRNGFLPWSVYGQTTACCAAIAALAVALGTTVLPRLIQLAAVACCGLGLQSWLLWRRGAVQSFLQLIGEPVVDPGQDEELTQVLASIEN